MERTKQGEFAWTDLSATDFEGQTAFYEGLFGWEHHDLPFGGGATYRIFTKDGHSIGGMSQMPPDMMRTGMAPFWNAYIAVDDVAASLSRAVELGAAVAVPVTPVGTSGSYAALVDPTGGAVFLWKNKEPDTTQVYGEPGALAWNDLETREPEKAAAFYSELVGWEVSKLDQGPMPYWQIDIGGAGEGGIMPMPDMVPPEVPAYWLDYFGTADIAASIAKAKELGATVTVEPAAVGGMVSFAVLEDPAGATFALMQPLGSM